MTELPPWTLPQFEQYVEIALEMMAKQGAVRTDASGKPIYRRELPSQGEDGTLRIELVADLSASGLPGAVPISATTRGAGPVVWSLGNVPMATIPGEWMPEEAGEAMGRYRLRAAYRQWEKPGRGGGHGR